MKNTKKEESCAKRQRTLRKRVSHALRHKLKAAVALVLIAVLLVTTVQDPLSLIANIRQAVFDVEMQGVASPSTIELEVATPP